jgi:hypothetical protein
MNHNKCVASFRKFIWEECFKEQGNIFVLVLISVNRHYANMNHTEITNRMQPCIRIYYSNVYQLTTMNKKPTRCTIVLKSLKLYCILIPLCMFRGTLAPIIRSLLILHIQPSVTVFRWVGCIFQLWSVTTVAFVCLWGGYT